MDEQSLGMAHDKISPKNLISPHNDMTVFVGYYQIQNTFSSIQNVVIESYLFNGIFTVYLPACLACLPALPACLPACLACLPTLPAYLACLPCLPSDKHSSITAKAMGLIFHCSMSLHPEMCLLASVAQYIQCTYDISWTYLCPPLCPISFC